MQMTNQTNEGNLSTDLTEGNETTILVESIPSMDEFKDEITNSFKRVDEGDIIQGTVIGVTEAEVMVDLGYYAEGIIKLEELSNDPRFSIKGDIHVGDAISAYVLKEDNGEGSILLSKKKADDILAWDSLKQALTERTVNKVVLSSVVNGGIITYLNGIRAFIPASQLSLSYVDNLEDWVKKEVDAIVITANEEEQRLVLSAKEVEKEKALADKSSKISRLQKGIVTTGTIDKITPYGAFVSIGDGLSGLVHISQICGKHIKSPHEIVKEGQEVKVKIIDIKEGKVSLSMKAVEENEDVLEELDETPFEFTSGEEVGTGLASLLANFKL